MARVTKNLWPSLMHVTITKEMIRMSIVFSFFFLILEFHLESKIESIYLLSWEFFPVDNQNNITSQEPQWMIIHSFILSMFIQTHYVSGTQITKTQPRLYVKRVHNIVRDHKSSKPRTCWVTGRRQLGKREHESERDWKLQETFTKQKPRANPFLIMTQLIFTTTIQDKSVHSPFTGEETEVQRGKITWLRPLS